MDWPSKTIPQGGILHPAKAKYSPETHQFLKVLMEESKLSMMQQKKINYILRNGEPLPVPGAKPKRKNIPEVTIRPGSSRRRTREDIVRSGAYNLEPYRACLPIEFQSTTPIVDREKEKDRLATKMAFNEDIKATKPKVIKKLLSKEPEKEQNRFDQLVEEIKEREQWLAEMEELGQGEKYRLIIQQQIEDKVREMQRMKPSNGK